MERKGEQWKIMEGGGRWKEGEKWKNIMQCREKEGSGGNRACGWVEVSGERSDKSTLHL